MERTSMSKKGLYWGTGIGLILFVLVGMLGGSVVGGVLGLLLAGLLHGAPVEGSLLPRVIVVCSAIVGIFGSAVTLVGGMGFLGWASGFLFHETIKAVQDGAKAHH